MSGDAWVTADPHFFHYNILKFKRRDGVTPLRPFASVEDMNETIVQNWNDSVKPSDRVYLLGDVVFHNKHLHIISRLNGRKVLVKGNHDILKLSQYLPYFDDIRAYVPKKGYILSHIPVHPASLSRWKVNIHGHLHADVVRLSEQGPPDPRYHCVSVENTNYKPVHLQSLLKQLGVG